MKALFYSLFFFLVLLLSNPVFSKANNDFLTTVKIEYRYNDRGESQVTHHLSLTNRISQIYATSFKYSLLGENPKGISGSDSNGPLDIQVATDSSQLTSITVHFTQPVAGKNKTREFSISYSGNPAVKKGQLWELRLPQFSSPEFADNYELHVYTPASFGDPASVKPNPISISRQDSPGYRHLFFGKDQITNSGIIATFGSFETLDFSLKYKLNNPDPEPRQFFVLLPPDTAYQKILLDKLSPEPSQVNLDESGNWLAYYNLPPQTYREISVSGQAHLLKTPSSTAYLPISDKSGLDGSDPNWATESQTLKSATINLNNPSQIYLFVQNKLIPNLNPASFDLRRGSLEAFSFPETSSPLDYTDLFITLCRISKIPSREIIGYSQSTNSLTQPLSLFNSQLHAWAAYLDNDSQVWKEVDPAWEAYSKTDYFSQLNTLHFTLAIHGPSSTQPDLEKLGLSSASFAPGTFKDYLNQDLKLNWSPPFQALPLQNNQINLLLSNPNGLAQYQTPIYISQASGKSISKIIAFIPPFGSVTIPVSLGSHLFPPLSPQIIAVRIGDRSLTYNIPDSLFTIWYAFIIVSLSFAVIFLAFFAFKTWHLYLQKQPR